jgi:hypothetical protein
MRIKLWNWSGIGLSCSSVSCRLVFPLPAERGISISNGHYPLRSGCASGALAELQI